MRQSIRNVLIVLALVVGYQFMPSIHPCTEAERAIWNSVLEDDRFTEDQRSKLRVVRWRTNRSFGDLSPTEDIWVTDGTDTFHLKGSAHCDEEGWKGAVHSIIPE